MMTNKFRPHSFDEMVGQHAVVENIRNQSKKGKFFQGYTLCGQFGSGKTTMARILSLVLNCDHKDEQGNPCQVCESCKAILEGNAPDVIEIDAASNTGVDNIRALKEDVRYLPSLLKKKVYIIDEVQRLSTGAFDALLKVLEEPPVHVAFILCTTERNKIPKTILSRTAVYQFGCIGTNDISGHLEKVAQSEGIVFEPAALELIAKNSQGAMRNALSLLEQISSAGDVTESGVASMLGIAEVGAIASFVDAVLSRDKKRSIEEVMRLLKGGIEPYCMVSDCLEFLADAILCSYGQGVPAGTKDYACLVYDTAKKYSSLELSSAINGFTELRKQVRMIPEHNTVACGVITMLSGSMEGRIAELEKEIACLKEQIATGVVKKVEVVDDSVGELKPEVEKPMEESAKPVVDSHSNDGWESAPVDEVPFEDSRVVAEKGEDVSEDVPENASVELSEENSSVEEADSEPDGQDMELPVVGDVYLGEGGRRFRVEKVSNDEMFGGGIEIHLLDLTMIEKANYPITNLVKLSYFQTAYVREEDNGNDEKVSDVVDSDVCMDSCEEASASGSESPTEFDIFDMLFGEEQNVSAVQVEESVAKENTSDAERVFAQKASLDAVKDTDILLESILELGCETREISDGLEIICGQGESEPVGRILKAYEQAGKIPVPVSFAG